MNLIKPKAIEQNKYMSLFGLSRRYHHFTLKGNGAPVTLKPWYDSGVE